MSSQYPEQKNVMFSVGVCLLLALAFVIGLSFAEHQKANPAVPSVPAAPAVEPCKCGPLQGCKCSPARSVPASVVNVLCYYCKRTFPVAADTVGRVECPYCRGTVVIPGIGQVGKAVSK